MYSTGHESNPYGIQWMRYGPDSKFPKLVREVTPVAFEAEGLDRAIDGKEIITIKY